MKLEIDFDKFRSMPDVYRPLVLMFLQALSEEERLLVLAELRAVQGVDADAVAEKVADEAAFKQDIKQVVNIDVSAAPAEAKPVPVVGATTRLDDLHPHLSNKTINALHGGGFDTLGDLADKTVEMLLGGVDRFGRKGANELTAVMEAAGLWPHQAEPPKAEPPKAEPAVVVHAQAEHEGSSIKGVPFGEGTMPVADAPEGVVVDLGQARVSLATEAVAVTNGQGDQEPPAINRLKDMTTQELSKHAVAHLGPTRTAALLTAQGVTKIAALKPAEEDAYRRSLIVALIEVPA